MKKKEQDITDFLDQLGREILRSANGALVLFWRKVTRVARLFYSLSAFAYRVAMVILSIFYLFSFGVEILFFTNLPLGWKILGWVMLVALIILIYSTVQFIVKRNHTKKETFTREEEDFALIWLTLFFTSSVFITWIATNLKISGFFGGYSFKFIVLKLTQENIYPILISFCIFVGIIAVLYIFVRINDATTEKSEDIEKQIVPYTDDSVK